jgi:DNA-binding MarR family transcriptional regulator
VPTKTPASSPAPPAGELLASSIGFLLSKIGFASAGRFAAELAPLDMSPGHFALLRYVDAGEGQSQQAFAEALSIPPSRMVALVDELETRGLVERRRNPHDRRAHALHLTAKGHRMLEKATAIATKYEERLCSQLSLEERATLLALLHKLAAAQDLPLGVHPKLVADH